MHGNLYFGFYPVGWGGGGGGGGEGRTSASSAPVLYSVNMEVNLHTPESLRITACNHITLSSELHHLHIISDVSEASTTVSILPFANSYSNRCHADVDLPHEAS